MKYFVKTIINVGNIIISLYLINLIKSIVFYLLVNPSPVEKFTFYEERQLDCLFKSKKIFLEEEGYYYLSNFT